MTERSTRELEHDVEEARERLLSHLSVLSSPVALATALVASVADPKAFSQW